MQSVHYESVNHKASVRIENISVEDFFIIEEAELHYFKPSHNLPEIIRVAAISLTVSDADLLKLIKKLQNQLPDMKVAVQNISFDNQKIEATVGSSSSSIPLSVTAKLGLFTGRYGGLTIDFPPLGGALGLLPIPIATIARQILHVDERVPKHVVVKQDDSDTIFVVPRISSDRVLLVNPTTLSINNGSIVLRCTDNSTNTQGLSESATFNWPFLVDYEAASCRCPTCIPKGESTNSGFLSSVTSLLSGLGQPENAQHTCTASPDELIAKKRYDKAVKKLRTTHKDFVRKIWLLVNHKEAYEEALRICDLALDTYEGSREIETMKALILGHFKRYDEAAALKNVSKEMILLLEGDKASTEGNAIISVQKYEEAFELNPLNPHSIRRLALSLMKTGHRPRSVHTLWALLYLCCPDDKEAARYLRVSPGKIPAPVQEAAKYTDSIRKRTEFFGKGAESNRIEKASHIIEKIAQEKPDIYLRPTKAQSIKGDPLSEALQSELKPIFNTISSILEREIPDVAMYEAEVHEVLISDTSIILPHCIVHENSGLRPHLLLHSLIQPRGLSYTPHQALPSLFLTIIRRIALESVKEPKDEDGLIGNYLSSKVKEMTATKKIIIPEGKDLDNWVSEELRRALVPAANEFVNDSSDEKTIQKAIANKVHTADRAFFLMTGDFFTTVRLMLVSNLSAREVDTALLKGVIPYITQKSAKGKESMVFTDLVERVASLAWFAISVDGFISDEATRTQLSPH